MSPLPCFPVVDPYQSHAGTCEQQILVTVTAPQEARKRALACTLTGRDSHVENSPDIGIDCKRYTKAHAKYRWKGRAGDWVEGVTFESKTVGRKAGLKGAGFPGTLVLVGQGRRGLGPSPYPQVLPGPWLQDHPSCSPCLKPCHPHSTSHHSPPGTGTTTLVLQSSILLCCP